MKLSLFALLTASVSAQFEKRIVGGSTAATGQFPYQVSIQTSSHACGGSIIDSQNILTAAQCVNDREASHLRVRVGSAQHASGGKLFQVAKITQHSDYNANTLENDIAVLRLQDNLEFGSNIAAVELPSSELDTSATGAKCSVTGWGTTSHGGERLPANLLFAYLNIIDHESCVKAYDSYHPKVNDMMVCAGVPGGGKGACQEDTGGPLVDQSSKKQVGIVSWSRGCGQHAYPGVYTSTAAYAAWIQETILLEIL
ncbi:hypothetical protein N7509_012724 [Penicillium cosmopolitanum]|uniref:Peptidase S1 domain-containing protein n=1 Tax=Penicillium cosmopolitanum TaxID=1131564 RepID=A0A9W9SKG4_9EURO|nr:uncharacterized protein N7509_012724 [Penicillium cosmopolitanum]XP_057128524.1 uncharacterized protein N7481_001473 [Penicillium waksmanii]KAJ5379605.1 hypothetical protein N7509_012724 [Penicillium cosmopolitanum]KAJ6001064.1 hypothetical protein N7481_001473 [Penicillium waksmanii]